MSFFGPCKSGISVRQPPTWLCPTNPLRRWGQPFLEHTFLYHLHRLDHRHNFSPYFYPIYLQRFNLNRDVDRSAFPPTVARFIPPDVVDKLTSVLRDPLVSFLPQMALVAIAGPPRTSLAFTMFVQTAAFVVWNKVCTSQVSSGPKSTGGRHRGEGPFGLTEVWFAR
jgi:hypothetical protein